MHPNKLLSILSVVAVFSCGPSAYQPSSSPHHDAFVAGAACDSNSDCGSGFCGSGPGGYCAKNGCTDSADCGPGGICIRFRDVAQCRSDCSAGGTADCRPGYFCAATTEGTAGYCEDKEEVGSACSSDVVCASGECAGAWPGGYCTNTCSGPADCAGDSTCVSGELRAACLANCAAPNTQSTCRTGYTCVGLVGKSSGVCVPAGGTGGSGGGAGGSGGGTGGSGGGTGGSGGGTGGSGGSGGTGGFDNTPCRTYATQYTSTMTGPQYANTTTHTVTFDRATLTYTDSWTGDATGTRVEHYRTLADFIDQANPTILRGHGGPSSVTETANGSSLTTAYTYDSSRRVTSYAKSGADTGHGTAKMWDGNGRLTLESFDSIYSSTEKCIGQQASHLYNDVTHTVESSWSGGTNYSSSNADNCLPYRWTWHYASNFLINSLVFAIDGNTYWVAITNTTTATVCK